MLPPGLKRRARRAADPDDVVEVWLSETKCRDRVLYLRPDPLACAAPKANATTGLGPGPPISVYQGVAKLA